jgi:hypothetical protein
MCAATKQREAERAHYYVLKAQKVPDSEASQLPEAVLSLLSAPSALAFNDLGFIPAYP